VADLSKTLLNSDRGAAGLLLLRAEK